MAPAKRQLSDPPREETKRVRPISAADSAKLPDAVATDDPSDVDEQVKASPDVAADVEAEDKSGSAADEVSETDSNKTEDQTDSSREDQSAEQAVKPSAKQGAEQQHEESTTEAPQSTAQDSEPKADPSKSKDETDPVETDSKATAEGKKPKLTVFGNFGSKFTFGGASAKRNSLFLSNSTNPWAEPSKVAGGSNAGDDKTDTKAGTSAGVESGDSSAAAASSSASAAPVAGTESGPDRFAKVRLEPQAVKTGEEDEEEMFSSRAALYALNLQKTSEGWKNRGTGTFHLNRTPGTEKVRIVMRADGLLRVILNVPVLLQSEVSQGFPSSSASEKFVRFHGVEDNVPHQYAVRLPSKEQADAFYESMTRVVDSAV